ncbi:SCP2 sterol-binding domain-containing protein [uncultured Williamsia sp.]|uniref:SCP2 sterol-binding domain-containing protein n=1 Tax=uncultured Williamsia sp. TaxID=259311 RepID=UPI00262A7FBA|nr:SCP2 sterol-binding domain-containing protein [uncultured Williamsia sp.]
MIDEVRDQEEASVATTDTAGFATAEEVRRYIGGIFEAAFADPELGPRLAAVGIVLAVECTEPDARLVIDTGSGTVHDDGPDAPVATATMAMSSAVSNAYWQGKVNLPMAMARKRITVSGEIGALLKLAPLSKKLFPVYVERLRADGRDDLVVA